MKAPFVRRVVSVLLIISTLWWTSGCYTTRQFTNLDELRTAEDSHKKEQIEVITKQNRRLVLAEWHVDSTRALNGVAVSRSLNYSSGDVGQIRYITQCAVRIPADSVNVISIDEFNTGLTLLAATGIAAAFVGICSVVSKLDFSPMRVILHW